MASRGEAKRAAGQVRQALQTGRLVQAESCQTCGAKGDLVGHHYRGYRYPLSVWWICMACNEALGHLHDDSLSLPQARDMVRWKRVTKAGRHKTDNGNLQAKLALRRYFLDKYHAGQRPSVFDCCQGERVIWTALLKDYACDYWGADRKPKRGRLRLDSVKLLAQPGWNHDVIDIDTYGLPWKHWLAMLPHVTRPTTVFLTIGMKAVRGGSRPSHAVMEALGMPPSWNDISPVFGPMLSQLAVDYLLARPFQHGLDVIEAMEAVADGHARYLGVRLAPTTEKAKVTDGGGQAEATAGATGKPRKAQTRSRKADRQGGGRKPKPPRSGGKVA